MCKVSDKSEMVGEIIGWFDMELPYYILLVSASISSCIYIVGYG